MIAIRTENGATSAQMEGSAMELCADAAVIVNALYHAIRNEDAAEGERFRRTVCQENVIWSDSGLSMKQTALRVPDTDAQ